MEPQLSLPRPPQRTTPGFAFSIVERALRDCIAERGFGAQELQVAAAFFGGACAFCGGPIQRWDHLVSVSAGGDTVLGNMVPACAKCDDSKQGSDFEAWARGAAPSSPTSRGIPDIEERLSRLREYVSAYGYQAREPEDRLTADELRQYEVIRRDLQKARDDADEFLRMYRQRTGLK